MVIAKGVPDLAEASIDCPIGTRAMCPIIATPWEGRTKAAMMLSVRLLMKTEKWRKSEAGGDWAAVNRFQHVEYIRLS